MREIEGAGSPIKPNRKATGRFEELQVLRGYAASMVVIVHCIAAWQPLAERDEFSRTAADVLLIPISGRAPVILFFVLSGFVLTHSLLNSQGGRWSIVAFYVRRLFRIMPAAIAGLVLMILAAEFARRTVPSWATKPIADFLNVFKEARLEDIASALLIWNNGVNPAYWTLHVELVGSLVMPALVGLGLLTAGIKRLETLVLLVIIGLALPFVPLRPTPLSHMSSMTVFCFPLGVLAYFAYSAGLRYRAFHGWIATLVFLIAHCVVGPKSYIGSQLGNLALLDPIMGTENNLALYAQHLLEGLGAAVLVGALAAVPAPHPFFSSRFATFIGRISYSLYIVHLPVLVVFIALFYLCRMDTIHITPIVIVLVCATVVFIFATLIAWLSYKLIEQPGNDLGKRFRAFSQPVPIIAARDTP